jgi:hypothetical protein
MNITNKLIHLRHSEDKVKAALLSLPPSLSPYQSKSPQNQGQQTEGHVPGARGRCRVQGYRAGENGACFGVCVCVLL